MSRPVAPISKSRCFLAVTGLHLLVFGGLAITGKMNASKPTVQPRAIMIDLADFQEAAPRRSVKAQTTQNPPSPVLAPAALPSNTAEMPSTPAEPRNANAEDANAQQGAAGNPDQDHLPGLADQVRDRIQAKLQYPDSARRRGISGVVRLDIILAPNGQAVAIQVRTSSGSAILDKDAVALAGSVLPVSMAPGQAGNTTVRINVNYSLPR